jgi:hypothetical protein
VHLSGRLQLEHPCVTPCPYESVGPLIVRRQIIGVDPAPQPPRSQLPGLVQRRVHPQAEQVQLREPHALQVVLVVLAAQEPLRPRRLQRHELRKMVFPRPEHHAPAVGASLLDAADEPGRELQEEPVPIRVLQRMAVHGRLGERLLPAGEAGVDPIAVLEAGGDLAAEGVDLLRRMPERPRRHPHGSSQ